MEWVSAKDRLTEKSGTYLTFLDNEEMEVLDYSQRHKAFNADDDDDGCAHAIYGVTHWMPLPKPPK